MNPNVEPEPKPKPNPNPNPNPNPHQAGLRCHFSGEGWPLNVAEAMASPYYGGYAAWGSPDSPNYRAATAGCPRLPAPV